MKNLHLVSIAAIALLAGCGGATSSPTPIPTTKAANKVAFAATALGAKGSSARRAQDCSPGTATEVALQAIPTASPPTGVTYSWAAGYNVAATEYNDNCQAETAVPTFSFTNSAIASSSIPTWVGTVPAAASGSVNLAGLSIGKTTMTATFPDNTAATITLGVYGVMGISCESNRYFVFDGASSSQYALPGWSAANGYVDNENGAMDCQNVTFNPPPATFTADVEDDNSGDIVFPFGYDVVSQPQNGTSALQALSAVANCGVFTSQGTTVTPAQIQAWQSNPFGVLLFKTSTGACVKFYPLNNEIVSNSFGGTIVGLYAVSDSSGAFSY